MGLISNSLTVLIIRKQFCGTWQSIEYKETCKSTILADIVTVTLRKN